jgi:Fur family peroxide stress response transcriptional regulator
MAKNGTILKLEINNEFRFDADLSDHQHCICRNCGNIFDMFEENINKYAMRNFKLVNFTPSNVSVIFHGLCKNCEENKNE